MSRSDIKVLVNGAKGRMGSLVAATVRRESGLALVGETDLGDDLAAGIRSSGAEVVVDFTRPQCAVENTEAILRSGANPVIGTTGFKPEEIRRLETLAAELGRGGIIAPNFAIGAVLAMKFAAEAARYFPDVEVIELHHDQKLDAPSGTAIKAAEWIHSRRGARLERGPEEKETIPRVRGGSHQGIPIHSVRLPGLVAHLEILLGGTGQLLTLRHDSLSRESFMPGVMLAIRKVRSLGRLVYGLEGILDF